MSFKKGCFNLKKNLKIVLLSAVLVLSFSILLSPAISKADNGTAICKSQTANPGSNVGTCINRIYVISLAAGGTIAVLMFVIAGYMYMSGGDGPKKAKGIIFSTITGLVILFSAYLFLNTINPDLTSFTGLSLPNVTCSNAGQDAGKNLCAVPNTNLSDSGGGTSGSSSGDGKASPTSQAAAKILLDDSGKTITIEPNSSDCNGNGPLKELTDISNGNTTQRDGPSGCNLGTTDLNAVMLHEMHLLAAANLKVDITAFANGHHSTLEDPHYRGSAVDLVPFNPENQTAIVQSLFSGGASKVGLECAGQTYMALSNSTTTSSSCHKGMSGYHLHAQW